MAKLDVLKLNGEKASTVELNDAIWNIEVNEIVLSEAVRLQMASLRQGTHDTKGRSEVSGGGKNLGDKKELDVLVKVQLEPLTG